MDTVVNIVTLWTILRTISGQVVPSDYLLASRSNKSWFDFSFGVESTVSIVDRSPPLSFPSRPAAFGPEISGPILGYVIPLSSFTTECPASNVSDSHLFFPPNTGCPKLCINGPHQPDPTESWIALVQRGSCEFVSKVRESQRLGARAVVIGNQDPEISGLPDTLVNMYSPEDASDVKISSTFIKYSDYTELSSLIASSNTSHSGLKTLSLLITADYSPWEWYSPIITFVIILFLPSLLTFITLLIHRIRAARAARRDRAPEDVVRNLPWLVWTGTGWEKHEGERVQPDLEQGLAPPEQTVCQDLETSQPQEEDASCSAGVPQKHYPWFENQHECAICLSDFSKGDKIRILPCQHIFHLDEVDEWLIQRKKLCPVCKSDVTQSGQPDEEVTDEPAEALPPVDTPPPTRTFFLRWPILSRLVNRESPPIASRNDEQTRLLSDTNRPNNYSDGQS